MDESIRGLTEVVSRHLLEGTEKNQGPKASRCGGRDSNSVPSEYKSDNSVTAKCFGEFLFFWILVARVANKYCVAGVISELQS